MQNISSFYKFFYTNLVFAGYLPTNYAWGNVEKTRTQYQSWGKILDYGMLHRIHTDVECHSQIETNYFLKFQLEPFLVRLCAS